MAHQCAGVEPPADGESPLGQPVFGAAVGARRFAREFELEADLVTLAMGFLHPEHAVLDDFGVAKDDRGNCASSGYATSRPGVFVAGDMRRGQSLVVWAISEGRECARAVDEYLIPQTSGVAATSLQVGVDELTGAIFVAWQQGSGQETSIELAWLADQWWQGPISVAGRDGTVDELRQAMVEAANGELKGILRAADEPLVSTDIIGETHSSIVDLELISQVAPNFFRGVRWYDNENSYSVRCVDLLAYMAGRDNA